MFLPRHLIKLYKNTVKCWGFLGALETVNNKPFAFPLFHEALWSHESRLLYSHIYTATDRQLLLLNSENPVYFIHKAINAALKTI